MMNARRSPALLAWLLVSQLLAALSLGLWLLAGGFAVLALDPGFSWRAALLAAAIWGYPLFPLGCAVGAWVARGRDRGGRAAVLSALPLVPPVGYLAWLFGSG